MRIFVAGATGVIGRVLVPLLVGAGHEVIGTSLTARGLNTLRVLGAPVPPAATGRAGW